MRCNIYALCKIAFCASTKFLRALLATIAGDRFVTTYGIVTCAAIGRVHAVRVDCAHRGILRFAGPISSLSMSTNATGHSGHSLTFGEFETAVPEPASCVPAVIEMLGMHVRRRHCF